MESVPKSIDLISDWLSLRTYITGFYIYQFSTLYIKNQCHL